MLWIMGLALSTGSAAAQVFVQDYRCTFDIECIDISCAITDYTGTLNIIRTGKKLIATYDDPSEFVELEGNFHAPPFDVWALRNLEDTSQRLLLLREDGTASYSNFLELDGEHTVIFYSGRCEVDK